MQDWEKIALGAAGLAGTIGIGYYAVNRLITPACAPGSACASAIQPYVNAWQFCANQYASIVKSDIQNGVNLSTDSQLAYFTQCMNANANEIANLSKQYNFNWEAVIEYWGETVIEGALIIAGAYVFFKSGGAGLIATAVRSGAAAANKLLHVITRFLINSGQITSTEASALTSELPSVQGLIQSYDDDLFNTLVTEEIITAEDAATLISEDTTDIVADFTATLDELAAI